MKKEKYLSIGNTAKQVGVPPYTIRYWEKEFSEFLHPKRSSGKQRQYSNYELDLLKRIKKMLKIEKYSIAGARQKLRIQLTGSADQEKQNMLLAIAKLINDSNLIDLENISLNDLG